MNKKDIATWLGIILFFSCITGLTWYAAFYEENKSADKCVQGEMRVVEVTESKEVHASIAKGSALVCDEKTTVELIAVTPEGVKLYRINSPGKTIVPVLICVDKQGKCTAIR